MLSVSSSARRSSRSPQRARTTPGADRKLHCRQFLVRAGVELCPPYGRSDRGGFLPRRSLRTRLRLGGGVVPPQKKAQAIALMFTGLTFSEAEAKPDRGIDRVAIEEAV